MFQRLLRALGFAESTASFAEWSYRAWVFFLGLGVFGGIAAYTASLSDWLAVYGPIAYVAVFIVAALALLLLAIVALWAAEKWTIWNIRRKIAAKPDAIDPMASQFYNKRIHISDLLPPAGGRVIGKTFERCQIIGPINIYPFQTIFDRCTYTGVDHIVVDPNKINRIFNARGFDGCIFRECEIFNVSFLITSLSFEVFNRTRGCNWITFTPEEPAPWIEVVAERLEHQGDAAPD